ncbi:MAG TPA: hypothetical protein VF160_07170 [Candidatus Dormibacteraeota bacterium]
MSRSLWDKRREALRDLSSVRGGRRLISYVTSTRPNWGLDMRFDVITRIHRQLEEVAAVSKAKLRLDLFIHSGGGDITVPWRLMTLMRDYSDDIDVLVPHWCYSAATLTALGAERIVMHRMGTLGPIDPSLEPQYRRPEDGIEGQIQVEDVAGYVRWLKDQNSEPVDVTGDIRLLPEAVHPLALGAVWRTSQQGQMLARKMLTLRKSKTTAKAEEVIKKLGTELFYHGHPIGRVEARQEIGLDFVEFANRDTERAMWRLYSLYAEEMQLHEAFNAVHEALAKGPLVAPKPISPPGDTPPTTDTRTLDLMKDVFVESESLSLYHESQVEVTLARDYMGRLLYAWELIADRWGEAV